MAADRGVQGLDALSASLDAAAHEVAGLLEAHRDAGHLLQPHAETEAPKATGYLASRHQTVVEAGRVEVINATPYGPPVHARDPWLARTLAELREQLLDIYSTAIARAVANVHGR